MKLQGYDSARDFTRKIDEQIAKRGSPATAEVTRFARDAFDRTRRQR
jgi:hypothetical protein